MNKQDKYHTLNKIGYCDGNWLGQGKVYFSNGVKEGFSERWCLNWDIDNRKEPVTWGSRGRAFQAEKRTNEKAMKQDYG